MDRSMIGSRQLQLQPTPPQTPEQLLELRQRALDFIDSQELVQLITAAPGKAPSMRLVGFARDEGFTILMLSVKPSAKLRDIEANPRVTLIWNTYDDRTVRMVQIQGVAEVHWDVPGIRRIEEIYRRTVPEATRYSDEELLARRCAITVHPSRVRTEGLTDIGRTPVIVPL
jgi:hypothetical protein